MGKARVVKNVDDVTFDMVQCVKQEGLMTLQKVVGLPYIMGMLMIVVCEPNSAAERLHRPRIRERRERLRKQYEHEQQWHNGAVAVASVGATILCMYMFFPPQQCPPQPLPIYLAPPQKPEEPKSFFSNDLTNKASGVVATVAITKAFSWAFERIDWGRVGSFMGGLIMRTSTPHFKSMWRDQEAAALYAGIEAASIEFVDGYTHRSHMHESHDRAVHRLSEKLEDLIAYGQARCEMTDDGFERLNAYEELAADLLVACAEAAQSPDLERIRVVRSMLATLRDMLGA